MQATSFAVGALPSDQLDASCQRPNSAPIQTSVHAASPEAAATISVASELFDVEPPAFVAVTVTCSVLPATPTVGVKLKLVAPTMLVQLSSELVQRCHW